MQLKLPQEWATTLATVRSVAGNAALAGGCFRDLNLGGEVKDLDIFIPAYGGYFDLLVQSVKKDYDWRCTNYMRLSYDGGADPGILNAGEFIVPQVANKVQIIETSFDAHVWFTAPFAQWVIDRMDYGACQIAYDGYHWFVTDAAFRDIENRRITLINAPTAERLKRSLSRADRFRAKYQGTDVVVDTSAFAASEDVLDTLFAS